MNDVTYTCPICGFQTAMSEGFTIIHYGQDAHGFIVARSTE